MSRSRQLPLSALAGACAALALASCGNGSSPHRAATSEPQRATQVPRPQQPFAVSAKPVGSLPAAVEDPAVAPIGADKLVLLGGLDSADTSTAAITVLSGTSASSAGSLPNAQHDAQAAALGSYAYVFGGGQFSTYDHILRFDPASGQVTSTGTLPSPASDVAVAALGNTAYIVGGYDGTTALDTILAWQPGAAPRVVAHVPLALRYAAVTAEGSRLFIVGGTESSGASDAILTFDPATNSVQRVGTLPVPLTHASAATLDGRVLIVGGRRTLTGDETSSILAIDPATGHVQVVGRLPQPLSDAAVATVADRVIVAGGQSPGGAQQAILQLTGS